MKNLILLLILILGASSLIQASRSDEDIPGIPLATPVHTWTGAISSSWGLPGNWTPALVPASSDDIIIPLGTSHDPVLTRDISVLCRNITIQHLTEKSTEATVRALIISGGEIVIDGSMTIKAGALLVISPDGALTINGNLTIITGGNLLIESGGSLITNGNVTGTANVKREVQDGLSWHFLSSPVNNQAILNGVFAPLPADFSTTPSTCFDFYKFNSACDPLHWINLRKSGSAINTTDFGIPPHFEINRGYLVAYDNCLPKIKTFTGTPNTGNQVISLSVGQSACNWDLLGNPFPSAFKWDEVMNKSNLASGYYYVWNEEKSGGAGYEAYLDNLHSTTGVNGNIPAMQGFFVKVGVSGSSITIPNTSRIHDGNFWLKSTKEASPDKLKLTVSNTTNSDDAFILFEPNGTIGADWYDAEKIFSLDEQIPQIYTVVDNEQKNLINSLPVISGPVTVPVGISTPAEGNYSLRVSDLGNFTSLPGIILEDKLNGNSQNLLQNPAYYFSASPGNEGTRFLLHFFSRNGSSNSNDGSPISIFTYGNSLYISSTTAIQNGQVRITNMIGQQILLEKLGNQVLNEVKLDVTTGYYIVRVQTEANVKTAKVYLK